MKFFRTDTFFYFFRSCIFCWQPLTVLGRLFGAASFAALTFFASFISPAYATQDIQWYPFQVDEDAVSGIADFSLMNHPLTMADRLFVKSAHFYRVGEDLQASSADDERVRLFGINLSAAANFPKQEDAVQIAKKLRRAGFNAVRLHHLDSILSDSESQPRGLLTHGAYPSFNKVALARLITLIDAFRNQGLYINVNLHVGYAFRPGIDAVPELQQAEAMPFASQPLQLFEPHMIALQQEYVSQLLRNLNLKNDPVLAMIEISNESSLIGAWQRGQLDILKGAYRKILESQWQQWVNHQYGSTQNACHVWKTCSIDTNGAQMVLSSESQVLEFGEGWRAVAQRFARKVLTHFDVKLPKFLIQHFQTHQQGPGRRVLDFMQFLSEKDREYLETMRKTIRAEVGDLVPIAGTQMYFGGALNSDAQHAMDYVDEHVYVDHYDFPHAAWATNDWRIRNASSLREGWQSLLQTAFYRDAKKPFVVSEFNQPYPNQQGAEILPVLTAIASAQDWDGLFFFQYIDGDTWQALPSSFGLSGNWGQWVTTGISASMFRNFQIRRLPAILTVTTTPAQRKMMAGLRDNVSGLGYRDFLGNCYGVQYQHAFEFRVAVTNDTTESARDSCDSSGFRLPEMTINQLAPGDQLQYDSSGPWLTANTQYSAMFVGRRSEGSEALSKKTLMPKFDADSRQFGVLMLTSRDALPLSSSKRVLLTLSGATVGSQPGVFPYRAKRLISYPGQNGWWTLEPDSATASQPSGSRDATGPVWLERIGLQFFYASHAKSMSIYPLDASGNRMSAIDNRWIEKKNDGFSIHLNQASPWFEIVLK